MPYLGRRGALAPLTSADIPAGIVEGTDIAFLENSSGQTLAGTYSTERMYLSGRTGSAPNDYNYKLEGNVTVTGHLALGTIADEDVVITQDSTERTITGSGTLESGELLSSKETDLTGMTGVLGSVVTGSPNLNLGNATFPAGHVLQVVSTLTTTQASQTITTSDTQVGLLTKTITPKGANSDFLVVVRWFGEAATSQNIIFNIQQDGTRVNVNGGGRGYGLGMPLVSYGAGADDSSTPENVNFSTLVSTSSVIGTGITFKVVADGSGSFVLWNNRCFGVPTSGYETATSELIITEIKG